MKRRTRSISNTSAPPPPTEKFSDDETIPSENEVWYVLSSYFHRFGVVRHQLESYDNFMTSSLPHIIQESSELVIKNSTGTEVHTIALCNVSVQRPMMQECDGYDRYIMPHMARMRSVTYAANILVDIVHDIAINDTHKERRVFREVLLCRLPVMVGSMYCHTYKAERKNECRLDQGGYFIINGIEKALLAQVHHEPAMPTLPFHCPTRHIHAFCAGKIAHEPVLHFQRQATEQVPARVRDSVVP